MNKTNHKSLDLHGKTYQEAEILIDEFIIRNVEELPLEVITGNSVDMQNILKCIIENHNLRLVPSHPNNLGSYIINYHLSNV